MCTSVQFWVILMILSISTTPHLLLLSAPFYKRSILQILILFASLQLPSCFLLWKHRKVCDGEEQVDCSCSCQRKVRITWYHYSWRINHWKLLSPSKHSPCRPFTGNTRERVGGLITQVKSNKELIISQKITIRFFILMLPLPSYIADFFKIPD